MTDAPNHHLKRELGVRLLINQFMERLNKTSQHTHAGQEMRGVESIDVMPISTHAVNEDTVFEEAEGYRDLINKIRAEKIEAGFTKEFLPVAKF